MLLSDVSLFSARTPKQHIPENFHSCTKSTSIEIKHHRTPLEFLNAFGTAMKTLSQLLAIATA